MQSILSVLNMFVFVDSVAFILFTELCFYHVDVRLRNLYSLVGIQHCSCLPLVWDPLVLIIDF